VVIMARTMLLALLLALPLAGCGVDRSEQSVVRILLPLDGLPVGAGGAVRDARGLFDLEQVGVYVVASASAEDIESTITVDWPDEELAEPPAQAELTLLLPAGSGRTIEVLALVVDPTSGLQAHAGSTTEDLAGGTELTIDLELGPVPTSSVDETLALPDGVDAAEVVALHPVDVEHEVLYPAATFTPLTSSLEASAGPLPSGRSIAWTARTVSGEWVDLEVETVVP
jgi:hypothetical protein